MPKILSKAKKLFYQVVDDFDSDPYTILTHVPEVEKWAKYILKKHPEADVEVVMAGVWLHDVGHYPLPTKIDHAVRGEKIVREFLAKEKFNKLKSEKICHCVRAHRCKDVMPETIEAKIIACADSASHMTDSMYFYMAKCDKRDTVPFRAYAKIERDWRDLNLFPEVKAELKKLYQAWKAVLEAYENIKY
jgi:HD superfamily phosphodiesterase